MAYKENFLSNISVPLPTFSGDLNVLRGENLRDGYILDYPNYSVVMSADPNRRSPVVVAANIDLGLVKSTSSDSNLWGEDRRIKSDDQLDNDYYRNNPWDRGHMFRRSLASWASTQAEAQRLSDETYYWTNASLQHGNLNSDEWLAMENWVQRIDKNAVRYVSTFTGPIYGTRTPRIVRPRGKRTADIPAGFYKVIAYKSEATDALEVRAFIMVQDKESIETQNKASSRLFNLKEYQVSVRSITELTGVVFSNEIYEKNPLFFTENQGARQDLKIINFPEFIEVYGPEGVVGPNQPREPRNESIDVSILSAIVNPNGSDAQNEQITIENDETEEVNIEGWRIRDRNGNTKRLTGSIPPGATKVIKPLLPVQLGNNGGSITLLNDSAEIIDQVGYSLTAGQQGKVTKFKERV